MFNLIIKVRLGCINQLELFIKYCQQFPQIARVKSAFYAYYNRTSLLYVCTCMCKYDETST